MTSSSMPARRLAGAAWLLVCATPCFGQGRAPAGPQAPGVSVAAAYSGREGFLSRSAGFSAAFPLGEAGGFSYSASAGASHIRFPGRRSFPGELYETHAGLRAAGKTWSFGASARSNSDRPFNSPAETDFGLDASRPVGGAGPHRFLFGVSYSSRRSFLPGLPFPYVSYAYRSETLTLLLPFSARWKFAPGHELAASYHPPKYFSVSVSREFSRELTCSVFGGTALSQYLPADRPDKSHSLFIERPQAGLRAALSPRPGWTAEVSAAWGLRGYTYEGSRYDDRRGKVSVGSGPEASLSLRRNF